MAGREPFDFNTLSSGYAAVLDIVVDLIIRMEKQLDRSFDFSISGIVLIDEIETHLHLELQKNVIKLLTTVFPNIQFIVSSHSPFILNSLDNVVIYDLEKKVFVEHGLADVPYSGIVEGYFKADELSDELRNKFEEYKQIVNKPDWNNLFWSCGHCNSVKNQRKYDEHVIDCCALDPEVKIYFRLCDGNTNVQAVDPEDEDAKMTAELVTEVFNKTNSGMRVYKSNMRFDELNREMNKLYTILEELSKNEKLMYFLLRKHCGCF